MNSNTRGYVRLANRLRIPKTTRAILWDMDGSLLNSRKFDAEIMGKHLHDVVHLIDEEFIRPDFGLSTYEYCESIIVRSGTSKGMQFHPTLMTRYLTARRNGKLPPNPGVVEILRASFGNYLLGVVSSTPENDLQRMVPRGLDGDDPFSVYVGEDSFVGDSGLAGNGRGRIQGKPSPDPYLLAAHRLHLKPWECTVVEDSEQGILSAHAAGCHVIGVATGALTMRQLVDMQRRGLVHQVYENLGNELTHHTRPPAIPSPSTALFGA